MQRNTKNPLENRVRERNQAMKFYYAQLLPTFITFVQEVFTAHKEGRKTFIAGPTFSKEFKARGDELFDNLKKPTNVRFHVVVKYYSALGYTVALKADYTIIDTFYPDGGHGVNYKDFPSPSYSFNYDYERLMNYTATKGYTSFTTKSVVSAEVKLRELNEKKEKLQEAIDQLTSIIAQV